MRKYQLKLELNKKASLIGDFPYEYQLDTRVINFVKIP